jgi:hypothetical protein
MDNFPLARFVDTSHGAFGIMSVRGMRFYTCEEQNLGNQPRISCIPAGTYRCKRRRYNKGNYDTFEITGVPGRSLILFHVLNTEEGTEGCVGIGLNLGVLDVKDEDSGDVVPKLAITQSKLAHTIWMRKIGPVDEFDVTITDPRA